MQQRLTFITLGAALVATAPMAAQNLVPNGDFEQYSSCPAGPNQLDRAVPWMNAMPGAITGPTPDYFNACVTGTVGVPNNYFDMQAAHSGGGYAGICTYKEGDTFREYIEVSLTQPLQAGTCYLMSLHISLAGVYSTVATGQLGVYFSDTLVIQTIEDTLPAVPQLDTLGGVITDYTNWVQVTGTYEAHGGEQYIVIGNFHSDAFTTLVVLNPLDVQKAYYYIDDVSLVALPEDCSSASLSETGTFITSVYPNPVTDELRVVTAGPDEVELTIHDATGRCVQQVRLSGDRTLYVGDLPNGVYMYQLRQGGNSIALGKLLKQ